MKDKIKELVENDHLHCFVRREYNMRAIITKPTPINKVERDKPHVILEKIAEMSL